MRLFRPKTLKMKNYGVGIIKKKTWIWKIM